MNSLFQSRRDALVQAVNGNPISADAAWAVIRAWDEMAGALQQSWHSENCGNVPFLYCRKGCAKNPWGHPHAQADRECDAVSDEAGLATLQSEAAVSRRRASAASALSHEWMLHRIIHGWQVVECRRCHKFDKYRPMGHATEYPGGACA